MFQINIWLFRVFGLQMTFECGWLDSCIGAIGTFVGLGVGVSSYMSSKTVWISSLVVTMTARVRFVSSVLSHVKLEHGFSCWLVVANIADIGFQFWMDCLHMFLQTLAVRKHFLTNITLFRLGPGWHLLSSILVQVSHQVILQLTYLIESFATSFTGELFLVFMSLMVHWQQSVMHCPVALAHWADHHATVNVVYSPDVSAAVFPMVNGQMACHTWNI